MITNPDVEFNHFGMFVFDLTVMEAFYTDVLGFVASDRGVVRGNDIVFLSRDPGSHHQIILVGGRTAPVTEKLINQISLRVPSLEHLRVVNKRIHAHDGVSDIKPVNHVVAFSVYFCDPEGNRIEVFVDSPWYVDQPHVEELDLNQTDEWILADTQARYRTDPSFMPLEQWRAEFGEKIAAADAARDGARQVASS